MEDLRRQAERLGAEVRFGMVSHVDFSLEASKPHHVMIDDGTDLLAQTIIISTGASAKYLGLDDEKKYAGKFNIISQENQGIGPARNNAFKTVTGEYTWFIDNDDCIQPNCLKSVFEVIEKFDADITNVVHLKGYFTENPFKKNFDVGDKVKMVFRLGRNYYRGVANLQLTVVALEKE